MSNENNVVVAGSKMTIAFALDATGKMHAQVFLSLEAPTKDVGRLYHAFRVMAEHGAIRNPETFRMERAPIFGFKSFQCRIPCFRQGNVWLLTHGFIKKQDKWPSAEFDRALRIMAEHQARKGE